MAYYGLFLVSIYECGALWGFCESGLLESMPREEIDEIAKLFEVLYAIDQRLLREAEKGINSNSDQENNYD